MQVELLDTFLAVLENRNFNRTADKLEITQSTVSARISTLEKLVGAPLFERGRMGAIPTFAGLRFEQHARMLRASWNQACRDTSVNTNDDHMIRLAGQISLINTVLVDWAILLQKDNSHLSIDLQADYSAQIINDLSIGKVDIGVLYAPRYLPDLHIQEIGMETFTMVSTTSDSIADVTPQCYIYTGYTSSFKQYHQELLPHLTCSRMSVSHEKVAMKLLNRTGGATYLPNHLAVKLTKKNSKFRKVSDAPQIIQSVYSVVHVRRRHDSNIARALQLLSSLL